MGLLDGILGGSSGSSQSGGTSPLVKALLMMLAAKAATSYFGHKDSAAPQPAPSGGAPSSSGTIESGILAGMPSLESILDRFKGSGHDDKMQSWIGTGENKPIAPDDLGQVLGHDTIDELQTQSGMPRDQILDELSNAIPRAVDKATPNGRF